MTIANADVPTRTRGHGLFLTMGVVSIVIVVAAFVPSIVQPRGRLGPLTPLLVAHGLAFFAWLLLFVVQATLVATGRTGLHRRLGLAAAALALPLLPLGYATAIAMGRRGFDLSGDLHIQSDPLLQLVFPLGDLVTFAVCIAAGYWFRRRSDYHKRFMLLGTIGAMLPAPVAHLLGHNLPTRGGLIVPMLAALFAAPALYDRVALGRFHRVSLIGGVALILWGNVRAAVIGPSAAWHEFAAALVR